jgi:hypothetical protein
MGATLTQVLPLLTEHMHDNITEIFFTADKTTTPVMAGMDAVAMDDGQGRGYVCPIEYGLGSSASATFSVAQGKAQGTTAGSSALRDRWVGQACEIEAVCYWSRAAMLAPKGGDELFNVLKREMESKVSLLKKRIATYAVEQGWGRVGTIIAAPTSTTITIGQDEINRLDVGDEIVASSAISGAALRVTANTGNRVTGINPDTGVVTVAVDPTGGGGAWQNGDVVFFYGDRQDAGSPVEIVPFGLMASIPDSAPGATTFMGINRQNNPSLGGHRVAASGADHPTTFIRTANRLFRYGSKADLGYCSGDDWAVLVSDKDAVKTVEIKLGKYEIGFDAVTVSTLAGRVPITPDAMMEQGHAYFGPFSDKRYRPFMAHNDDLVNVDDIDGNQIVRNATSTNFEMRLFHRGQIFMPAPGKFAVCTGLPSS